MFPVILIVEDEVEVARSVAEALISRDYMVHIARDGREGIRALQKHRIDAIVSDIEMPKMDGVEFFKHVRANEHWFHIPFLFLTSKSKMEDVRFGKELGVDDYLCKPIHPDDLELSILSRIERVRSLTQSVSA